MSILKILTEFNEKSYVEKKKKASQKALLNVTTANMICFREYDNYLF
jgi:hypothetical protein